MTGRPGRSGGARVLTATGRERKSAAMKSYWEERRKARSREEARDALHETYAACRRYVRTPFHEMNDGEVADFARDQALSAKAALRIRENGSERQMDDDETSAMGKIMAAAILKFNRQDPRHADFMRYRRECELLEEERKRRMEQEGYPAQSPSPSEYLSQT